MKIHRTYRAVLVTVAAAGGAVTGATPSSAMASPGMVAIDVNLSKPTYPVVSHCELVAAHTLDPRFINFVVHASADAGGPSVPLATSVRCTVYDTLGGGPYGGASGALPGAHAEALGQATMRVGLVPALCVTGGSTYLDGTTVSHGGCP